MSDQRYWESKARIYDRITAPLARPMKSAALLAADAVRGETRVLEVAAGTGLFATAIADAAREVVATDYATAMVDILAKRVQEAGFKNVRREQADIKALHYGAARRMVTKYPHRSCRSRELRTTGTPVASNTACLLRDFDPRRRL